MAVRMKDIAQDLGVSLMTVSKALRNHRDISDETRDRVLKRIRELKYQPDWVARSMVTGRTFLVGLVLPDLMHSFFAEVAMGVSRKLQPLGYQVVITDTEENPETEQRNLEVLTARKVDGLIIASAQRHRDPEVFKALERSRTPYVLIDRMVAGVDANYVGVQDEDVGAIATEHLIAQGARRIAHIRGPAISTGRGRLRGYRRAMLRHGIEIRPEYIVSGEWGDRGGYEAMRQLLKLNPPPDAVFCYNDPVAAGAIKAVLEAGLKVPEQIAIIGAGNVHYSDLLRVPLSTVDQSSTLIGERAAELLFACMQSKKPLKPQHILIAPSLVIRDSSRRLGSAHILLCRHFSDDAMDRLRAEMPGCGSGVHESHVRKIDLRPSDDADLERGRALRLKGRRAAVPRSGGRTGDHKTSAGGGRAVGGADGEVIADRGVVHADVVSVRAPGRRIRRIHRGGAGNPVIGRLHRQVR